MGQYFSNDTLKSEISSYRVVINNTSLLFYTDNGVFSKKGMDFGSRLLINAVLNEKINGGVLDIGCGIGIIGITLNKLLSVKVDMIDISKRAVHLANMNIKANSCLNIKAYESDCYQNVLNKYNYIITNPPIRAGKNIVYKILMNAKDYLTENGILYLVIRKEQGAKSLLRDLKENYDVTILIKKGGYFVIKCKFC